LNTSNRFARPHPADCVSALIATARGDKKATLVIQHAKLVNVCSGEIQDEMSTACRARALPLSAKMQVI
jgi:adenine deaminase